jgi:hypothetical protein
LQAQLDRVSEENRIAQETLRQQEEQRRQQAATAAQLEHRRVQSIIAQIPDPEERQAEQLKYDAYRLNQTVSLLQKENQTLKQKATDEEMAKAKEDVITATIAQHGLPFSTRKILATAVSPEHLDQIVAGLLDTLPKPTTNQQRQTPAQQARLQQRIASGAEAVGGAVASQVPPEGPKKHSGDIMGLIQSTNYNLVRTRE